MAVVLAHYLLHRASMRPRHYAGESYEIRNTRGRSMGASMRPRHYAGESRAAPGATRSAPSSFNEAPALRRGKYALLGQTLTQRLYRFNEAPALRRGKSACGRAVRRGVNASMRPRHYAGESRSRPSLPCTKRRGFNEAPALRRGKCAAEHAPRLRRQQRFNEAPALRRGKWSIVSPPSGCSTRFNEAPALRRGK